MGRINAVGNNRAGAFKQAKSEVSGITFSIPATLRASFFLWGTPYRDKSIM